MTSTVVHLLTLESDQRLCAAIQEIHEVEAFYGYRREIKALQRFGRIGQSQTSLADHTPCKPALPPQTM